MRHKIANVMRISKTLYLKVIITLILCLLVLTIFENRELHPIIIQVKNEKSELGQILFESKETLPELDKQFNILVWKYGSAIQNRHLYQYSDKVHDPFEECSVKNCKISFDDTKLNESDLVIIHLHRTRNVEDLPKRTSWSQIWAFLTDESPYHTFLHGNVRLNQFNGLFNWSMSYRSDSDIPVPYGRTIKREVPIPYEIPKNKRRDVLMTVLMSNCGSKNQRLDYVKKLSNYFTIDIYGGCGNIKAKCPGHFGTDCHIIDNYMFYLAFENANCNEYITEKLWWNAFAKNSIPIVMGGLKKSYEELLPPHSFIHVSDFKTVSDLATYIKYLNSTGNYKEYYKWRSDYEILNEHGYFGSKSYHFCRACEALNFNSRGVKVYNDLDNFWSVQRDCNVGK